MDSDQIHRFVHLLSWCVHPVRCVTVYLHDEVGRMEWLEYLERWLEWMDISLWVSMVEKPCVVEQDMGLSVEAMQVVQEGSMDWTDFAEVAVGLIPWLDSSYKVQAEYQ